MISIDSTICNDFKSSTQREWLETNGIGGFAAGTISGAHSRRYHGLLTAATRPPLGRIRTVSKLDETLLIDGTQYEISSNQYPDTVHPDGYRFITDFRLDPFPVWRYKVDDVELEKKIFMAHGSNTTVCRWTLLSGDKNVKLNVRPLLAFVDYHHLQKETSEITKSYTAEPGLLEFRPYESLPGICLSHNAVAVDETGYWYRQFQYAIERERGFDFSEDLFQPFLLTFDLASPATIILSTERIASREADKLERSEVKRRKRLVAASKSRDDLTAQLVLAADQFIVKRGEGNTVIAGYPWFSDWGRDTMIALPGLTLATNRPKIAKGILLEFSKHISEGMLPNRFPDEGEVAEYNTVDATLWYFEAVRAYVETTNDHSFVKKHLYSKLSEIITWHLRGTRYNIHVDTDGLLFAGEPGVQLTWMDAKIGDQVITPRTGKAVEIQALWYNALRIMSEFAERFGHAEDAKKFVSMADLAKLSFNALFWNDEENCLYDVIENGDRDRSLRPNQIFAVSLRHSMLDDERARAVVDKLETELLTNSGLRSLAPSDPHYIPYYVGSPLDRDSAYHQGTVWAWLIGGFVDALKRVYPERKEKIENIISAFRPHLTQAGLGQISEIFDAEWPHSPRGCPAQAWSVAELLRIAVDQ